MKRFYWTGRSNEPRVTALARLTQVLDRHAIVLHFQRFSDVAIGLALEVEAQQMDTLQTALREIMELEGATPSASTSTAACNVLLNVTFLQGTGNLEIEVPDIPN